MLSCLTVQDNFYPRSPRGERPHHLCDVLVHAGISIHAPREGSDVFPSRVRVVKQISIHAPREGSDYKPTGPEPESEIISIHAPREGSDLILCSFHSQKQGISIHAPREGSD